jgi:SAM-dependent methyltransferase
MASSPSDSHKAWLARAQALWDDRSDAWDAMSATNAETDDRRAELKRLQSGLCLGPGVRLLDAGCGTGQFGIAFARFGCRVMGVDLSPAMLDRARRNAETAGVAIDFAPGPIDRMPAPTDAFDAVFARTVLQLLPDPLAALRELRRVLRPGGRLYASVPGALSPIYREAWRRFVEPDIFTVNLLMPWELEALLAHEGWTIADAWGDQSASGGFSTNTAPAFDRLADSPLMQQAAATTWGFIAE